MRKISGLLLFLVIWLVLAQATFAQVMRGTVQLKGGDSASMGKLLPRQPFIDAKKRKFYIGTDSGENLDVIWCWIKAEGAPSASLGSLNDTYTDTLTGLTYEKSATGWVLKLNLTGPRGLPGERGLQGASIVGPPGERGPSGPAGQSIVGPAGAAGKDGADGKNALPNFRTARVSLPAMALGAGVSIPVTWVYQGAAMSFPDTAYTVSAPSLVGPASISLSFRVTAISTTGCTVLVSAAALLPANTASLHLIAIHD